MRIGVFDSGKGGSFIATRLQALLPEHDFIVRDDATHVPYGTRAQAEILELTDRAIQPLIATCPIIVIACNTITTSAIHTLRYRYPNTMFVGLQPMIKPAAQLTHSHHILVLATPATLASARYHSLKNSYASDLVIDEPTTGHWPRLIEDGSLDSIDLSHAITSHHNGADIIVLACTHYLALIPRLHAAFPDMIILEPSDAIARRLRQLLAQPRFSSDQYD